MDPRVAKAHVLAVATRVGHAVRGGGTRGEAGVLLRKAYLWLVRTERPPALIIAASSRSERLMSSLLRRPIVIPDSTCQRHAEDHNDQAARKRDDILQCAIRRCLEYINDSPHHNKSDNKFPNRPSLQTHQFTSSRLKSAYGSRESGRERSNATSRNNVLSMSTGGGASDRWTSGSLRFPAPVRSPRVGWPLLVNRHLDQSPPSLT